MENTIQSFLAENTAAACEDLIKAFEALPEDKRSWKATEGARSAANMVAECAMNCDGAARLIDTRTWPGDFTMENYFADMAEVEKLPWNQLKTKLQTGVDELVRVLEHVADADLNVVVDMPFGAGPLTRFMTYSYWNMKYHEGQITYIGSMSNLV